MATEMIERMAADLGIIAYYDETEAEFAHRVSYSAMSSWIKTIAMDEPVGNRNVNSAGVSRRHMYERARAVLDMLCAVIPELEEWYKVKDREEHPVQLIRTRLLNHGDLINSGFDTNVALTKCHTDPLMDHVETMYGVILDEEIHYNGVAAIRLNEGCSISTTPESSVDWMAAFIRDAWWSSSMLDISRWQYYNPRSKAKSHYAAWQDTVPDMMNGIVLARSAVNAVGYEYYLMKPTDRLIHRLDPFLQERGEHLRFMYALRTCFENPVEANVKKCSDHFVLRLNARLPVPENNLLESYCWPLKHVSDNLNWLMNDYIWKYLSLYFNALGLRILEEIDG